MNQKHKSPTHNFTLHLMQNMIWGCILTAVALFIGMIGYHSFEQMLWVDAFVNAAMILSGMGPLTPLVTSGGKIFAGCYALFSGLAFIVLIGLMLAPLIQRIFHKVHLDN